MLDGFGYDSFRLGSHCKLLKAGRINKLARACKFPIQIKCYKTCDHAIDQFQINYNNDVGKKYFLRNNEFYLCSHQRKIVYLLLGRRDILNSKFV